MRVGRPDVLRPIAVVERVVAATLHDRAEGLDPAVERRATTVVLEAHEQMRADRGSRALRPSGVRRDSSPTSTRPESFELVVALDAERQARGSADRRTPPRRRRRRARATRRTSGEAGPPRAAAGRPLPRPRGTRRRRAPRRSDPAWTNVDVEPASRRTLDQRQGVAAVTVGAEQFGVEHADRRHGSDRLQPVTEGRVVRQQRDRSPSTPAPLASSSTTTNSTFA